ncbi:MAG: hypothetical protein H6621_11890 [Halobacteriovoraceae bacterium]|nr:hypothetical protein [Halobacteriovoraceae bacterium]MCB9095762.1 hypothetical protein [Halobacteriovoraceae bacterium]
MLKFLWFSLFLIATLSCYQQAPSVNLSDKKPETIKTEKDGDLVLKGVSILETNSDTKLPTAGCLLPYPDNILSYERQARIPSECHLCWSLEQWNQLTEKELKDVEDYLTRYGGSVFLGGSIVGDQCLPLHLVQSQKNLKCELAENIEPIPGRSGCMHCEADNFDPLATLPGSCTWSYCPDQNYKESKNKEEYTLYITELEKQNNIAISSHSFLEDESKCEELDKKQDDDSSEIPKTEDKNICPREDALNKGQELPCQFTYCPDRKFKEFQNALGIFDLQALNLQVSSITVSPSKELCQTTAFIKTEKSKPLNTVNDYVYFVTSPGHTDETCPNIITHQAFVLANDLSQENNELFIVQIYSMDNQEIKNNPLIKISADHKSLLISECFSDEKIKYVACDKKENCDDSKINIVREIPLTPESEEEPSDS